MNSVNSSSKNNYNNSNTTAAAAANNSGNQTNSAVRKDVLTKISKFLDDSSYKEFIESSSSFNQKLVEERKFRLPFLDSQTGVAQSDCCLWMTPNDRLPSNDQLETSASNTQSDNNDINSGCYNSGRIYAYPAKRWVKRKRQYLLDDIYLRSKSSHQSYGPSTSASQDHSMILDSSSNDTQQLFHQHHHSSGAQQHQLHHQHNNSSPATAHSRISDPSHHPHHPHHLHHHHNSTIISNPNNSLYNNNNNDSINNHNHHNDSSFMHDSSSNSNAYPWAINEQSKDATTSSKVDPDDSTSDATIQGDLDDPMESQPNHQQSLEQSQQKSQSTTINSNQNQQHNPPASSTPKKRRERKPKIEKSDDPSKPYKCDMCGTSYKTRPGLTYHRNHMHPQYAKSSGDNSASNNDEQSNNISTNHKGKPSTGGNKTPQSNSKVQPAGVNSSNHVTSNSRLNDNSDTNHTSNNKNGTSNEPICDFCTGTAKENMRTHQPEELVFCSECDRSGHPSCLQFSSNIMLSIKKYKWQCIECKSCGVCGTSDHDDKLLFCDDCDRGYHMYCLDPPLDAPPEGNWSCTLCIEEYHNGSSDKK